MTTVKFSKSVQHDVDLTEITIYNEKGEELGFIEGHKRDVGATEFIYRTSHYEVMLHGMDDDVIVEVKEGENARTTLARAKKIARGLVAKANIPTKGPFTPINTVVDPTKVDAAYKKLDKKHRRRLTDACLDTLSDAECLVYSRLPLGGNYEKAELRAYGSRCALVEWARQGSIPLIYRKRNSHVLFNI